MRLRLLLLIVVSFSLLTLSAVALALGGDHQTLFKVSFSRPRPGLSGRGLHQTVAGADDAALARPNRLAGGAGVAS
jgi:hypothetical protein